MLKRAGRLLGATGAAGGVFVVLVVVWIGFTVAFSGFGTWDNTLNILDEASVPLILAIGMTFVVLTTGFDLSIGGVLAGVGVLLGALISHGHSVLLSLIISLLGGGLFGLANGWLIGFVGLDFFVVTLGSMSAFGGLAMLYTNGTTISVTQSQFLDDLGINTVAGLPLTAVIAAAIALVAWLVLRYTAYGRSVYAIGNSREASRLAGLRVPLIACSVYVISGLLASVAGIIEVGRLTSASPNAGQDAALSAAAAVFLGGTALSGGVGGIPGTVFGVLLLTVISNGLNTAGTSSFLQSVITGVILVVAIAFDLFRRRGHLPRLRLRRPSARAEVEPS